MGDQVTTLTFALLWSRESESSVKVLAALPPGASSELTWLRLSPVIDAAQHLPSGMEEAEAGSS